MNKLTIGLGIFILFIVSMSSHELIILPLLGTVSGVALLIVGFKLFNKTKPNLAYYLSVLSAISFFSLIITEAILSYKLTWDDLLMNATLLLFYAFLIKKHQAEKKWSWKKGKMNTHEEYIELRYGKVESGGWDNWLPVAYIAAPKNKTFKVQYLTQPLDEQHQQALEAALREINFYLVDKEEPDPWSYAQYHCGTMADIYSNIHWSFFPVGWQAIKVKQDVWVNEVNNENT